MEKKTSLREIAALFLKLGTISFGGPAVHIAMMEDEVVRKRGWMTAEHFLDLVGATNLIPGPNSTELTMHCGYERAGWKGLIVAGAGFVLPAVFITAVFAWLYSKYGQLPHVEPFIFGIKPAVIAIIFSAVYRLGGKALKNAEVGILGLLTLIVCLLGVNEIAALFGCAAVALLIFFARKATGNTHGFFPLLLLSTIVPVQSVGILKIFLIFLKVGALLYGSGYVLFAFLDAELVSTGLLSRRELIDSVAVGQFTPGPLLSTATFIGWQLKGAWGAVVATIGIILPSFVFVALLNPLIPRIRQSSLLSYLLDAVNMAAVAVILAVGIEMGLEAITGWETAVIAVTGFGVSIAFKKMNSAFVVIGGALLGYLLYLI